MFNHSKSSFYNTKGSRNNYDNLKIQRKIFARNIFCFGIFVPVVCYGFVLMLGSRSRLYRTVLDVKFSTCYSCKFTSLFNVFKITVFANILYYYILSVKMFYR